MKAPLPWYTVYAVAEQMIWFGDCAHGFDICCGKLNVCVNAFVVKVMIQVVCTSDAFQPFDM